MLSAPVPVLLLLLPVLPLDGTLAPPMVSVAVEIPVLPAPEPAPGVTLLPLVPVLPAVPLPVVFPDVPGGSVPTPGGLFNCSGDEFLGVFG